MTIEVKVAHAETHFSELLSKVEAGEDVVISRGNEPIARLVRIDAREDRIAAIEALKGGAGASQTCQQRRDSRMAR